jgi:glycerol-3-phosphate dehydrogenase
MGRQTVQTDIAIIGGGIAGLWTLNQLRNRGYGALLFEQEALGSYQTVGSQGMIHGGIKYALAGTLSKSSETIAAMPAIWRQCLRGEGAVDLRGCRVLSEDFFLWSGAAVQSRVTSFLASKLLRGRVERVSPGEYPTPLQSPQFCGQVYRLQDLVLDVPSLVATLAGRQREAIFRIDWQRAALGREGKRAVIELEECTVVPRLLLLTAGAGNEALAARLGSTEPAMQRRPLQQVLVRHRYSGDIFGHCMGSGPSPRLTISSHRDAAGRPVWYLGGDLATDAAGEEPASLIHRAQQELSELLPWIDLGEAQWTTLTLDRAEPLQSKLLRPDSAFVGRLEGVENALAAWPTKLTLSPQLADEIERRLAAQDIQPQLQPELDALASLGRPAVATPYWDTLFP